MLPSPWDAKKELDLQAATGDSQAFLLPLGISCLLSPEGQVAGSSFIPYIPPAHTPDFVCIRSSAAGLSTGELPRPCSP